jgi:hypothetical protein
MKVIGCEDADWIKLTHNPVTGSCKHGNESSGSVKGGGEGGFLERLLSSSSKRILMH